MCSTSTRYAQYASCQKASQFYHLPCAAVCTALYYTQGKACCSLEGLQTVQKQHAATCGQARLDIIRLDLPLCHLCPNIGQWPETTSTARENSHGFQDFLPYLQHKRFCGVLDHLHSVAGFMACPASRSCASWCICQNGSGKAIRCKCFTNHSSCVIS